MWVWCASYFTMEKGSLYHLQCSPSQSYKVYTRYQNRLRSTISFWSTLPSEAFHIPTSEKMHKVVITTTAAICSAVPMLLGGWSRHLSLPHCQAYASPMLWSSSTGYSFYHFDKNISIISSDVERGGIMIREFRPGAVWTATMQAASVWSRANRPTVRAFNSIRRIGISLLFSCSKLL